MTNLKVPQEAKEEDFRKIDIKIEAKEPEVEPAAEDVTEVINSHLKQRQTFDKLQIATFWEIYLYIANLFVADAPMKEKNQEI